MTSTNIKVAWESFESDIKELATELRRNYRDSEDEKETAEINSSLHQLGQAAEAFFDSVGAATRDPEVRASTKRATRSFGRALTETFREVGGEVDKAIRQPAKPR